MNDAPQERQLGEYRLKELIGENSLSLTWLAEQISVSRLVLVDELRPDRSDQKDAFLADIRAKASVDHPLIGSVFEAVAEPGLCFYAHELLTGVTLAEREKAGLAFLPARLTHLLRRVSDAQIQHEALGHSTSPFALDAVHLDEHGVIRLKNLTIAGPRTSDQSERDIVHLGSALIPLVAEGQPGATRLLTLLSWMRGEGIQAPINWEQVRDYCMQIEHQLADSLSSLTPTKHGSPVVKKPPVAFIVVFVVISLIVTTFITMRMRSSPAIDPPQAIIPGDVTVPAGKYPSPDGPEVSLPAFRISCSEITIGQYAAFLETLEILAKDNREKTFDSDTQPAEKNSHIPTGWSALIAAATSDKDATWQGRPVSLDSPVIGVDWWDAAAYATWKQGRLPTQEEWFAALSMEMKSPTTLVPGPWAPVSLPTPDRTPAGLIGMAGSVCEWTSKQSINPANPLGGKLWVLIGGSYLKSGTNALSREWTTERSLRRPDIGFRIVFDAK
jgi:formylglycine-generating enzyme required for sulfatase activity